jgi:hypothetical protein
MAGATQPPDYYMQRTDMSCNLPTLDQKAPHARKPFRVPFKSNHQGPDPDDAGINIITLFIFSDCCRAVLLGLVVP